MIIDTAVFGSVEVDEDSLFQVPDGLLGFTGPTEFALISKQEDDVTLMWFQAVGSNVPCFVVFNPCDLLDEYKPILEASDLRALGGDSSALEYLVIAVVPDDITQTTINLKSPIVLNRRERIARQVILANTDYPIRFPLVPAESNMQASV